MLQAWCLGDASARPWTLWAGAVVGGPTATGAMFSKAPREPGVFLSLCSMATMEGVLLENQVQAWVSPLHWALGKGSG